MRAFLTLVSLTLTASVGFYACQQKAEAPSAVPSETQSRMAKLVMNYMHPKEGVQLDDVVKEMKAFNRVEADLMIDALYEEDMKRFAELSKNPVTKYVAIGEDGKETIKEGRYSADVLAEMKAEYGRIWLRKKFANEEAAKVYNKTFFTLEEESLDKLAIASFTKFPDPRNSSLSAASARRGPTDKCPVCFNPRRDDIYAGDSYNFWRGGSGIVINNATLRPDKRILPGSTLANDDLPGTGGEGCDYSVVPSFGYNFGADNPYYKVEMVPKTGVGKALLNRFGGTGGYLATGSAGKQCQGNDPNPGYNFRILLGGTRVYLQYWTYYPPTVSDNFDRDLGVAYK